VEGIDVAVIHGDGAMVGCGIIPRTDLFLAYLIKKHLGKPVVIVNHSVDFDHPALREMARHVYPLFDDVVFRDPLSVGRCSEFCSGRFAADTAFWFRPAPKNEWLSIAGRPTYFDVWPDTAAFDPSRPYVCVGASSILSKAWRPSQAAADFAALIQHLRTIYAGQIVLTVSGLSELALFRPVSRDLGLPLLNPTTPVQQAVDLLAHADAYIGGRWHSAIFALRGGAPIVPLSAKQSKMKSLMQAAGLPSDEFDAFDLGRHQRQIGHLLLSHLERGTELKARLREWSDAQAINCWDNVTYLRRQRLTSAGSNGEQ
jgi:polysaccharide pyruvyl transferase WcaK-like protein